ncbi:MAG TPA: recombinase family protein [Candidatus Angelobacter sp.]|nr:recombinase family protein [Candidatus Angelobacter sp.]
MTKKAIELIRVSTEAQAQDDRGGIPAQRAANLVTAARHGLEIVRTFQIEDVSGARVLASPEMREMLGMIESPEIAGVVAKEFSRLMRPEDLSDFEILARFNRTNTVLYLPDGPVDLSNKTGKLFGVLRAAMAGYERAEILERLNAGKEAIRRAGRHAGGDNSLPYGVAWDRQQGWRYLPEAEQVKQAFRLVLTTTRPYASIAAELGIPRTSLRVILQNPIWTGWKVYDQRRDPRPTGYVAREDGRQGYRRKVARDPSDVIRKKVLQGIVTEEEFQRVQEILGDRAARERIIRTQNQPRYTFNGFLACAVCGDPLYTHRNMKAAYFICKRNGTRARKRGDGCTNPYILASKVEPKVEELLTSRLQDRNTLHAIMERYLAGAQKPAGVVGVDLEAAKQLAASLEAKRKRILDSFIDGVISKAERDRRIQAIDTQIAGCQELLSDAVTRGPVRPKITVGQLAAVLDVFAGFQFLARDQKRRILAAARARVFMERYTIERLEIDIPQGSTWDQANGSHVDGHFPAAGA